MAEHEPVGVSRRASSEFVTWYLCTCGDQVAITDGEMIAAWSEDLAADAFFAHSQWSGGSDGLDTPV